jgi:acetolactate synthase-1/2/3 large subunit
MTIQNIKVEADESRPDQSQRLADYVAHFVAAQGVKTAFLVPGGGAMFLVDAFGRSTELDYAPNHHEQASAIAAEAYSRINGHLGCLFCPGRSSGPISSATAASGKWVRRKLKSSRW